MSFNIEPNFSQSYDNMMHSEVFQSMESYSSVPKSCSSPRKVDALVAKDLNELSLEDRENILNDIHGVSQVVDENPLWIEQKLSELESELQLITQKDAYQQAASKSEEYVKDRSLRLKFLRADCFNVSNAAGRMTRFFEQKLKIFGPKLLAEDIKLADLNSEDLVVLNNGHLELAPQRDRSGRQIFCNIRSRERFLNTNSLVRSFWVRLLS